MNYCRAQGEMSKKRAAALFFWQTFFLGGLIEPNTQKTFDKHSLQGLGVKAKRHQNEKSGETILFSARRFACGPDLKSTAPLIP